MNCNELNTKFQLFCTEEESLKKIIDDLKSQMPDEKAMNIDEIKLSTDLINAKMNDLVQGTNTAQSIEESNAITLRKKDEAVLLKVKLDRRLKEAEQTLQIVSDHKLAAYKALEECVKAEAVKNMERLKSKLSLHLDKLGNNMAELAAMEGVLGYQYTYHRFMAAMIVGYPLPTEAAKLNLYHQQITDRITLFKQSIVKGGGNNE